MAGSQEEQMAVLSAMFGDPWTSETLGAVLSHHNGSVEAAVESILGHDSGDPAALVQRLQTTGSSSNSQLSTDAEIAKQLAHEERGRPRTRPAPVPMAAPAPAPAKKGRGTPATLPPDFLRIPGQNSTVDADEALARMLQDELFTQELANNKEFAHLAGGSQRRGRVRASTANPQTQEGGDFVDKISEMGEAAKNKLTLLAAQWNTRLNKRSGAGAGTGTGGAAGIGSASSTNQETRGLLSGDDDGPDEGLSFLGSGSDRTALEMGSSNYNSSRTKKAD